MATTQGNEARKEGLQQQQMMILPHRSNERKTEKKTQDSLDNIARIRQQQIDDSTRLAQQKKREQETTDSLNLVKQKEQQRIKDSLNNIARMEQIRQQTEDSTS